MAKETALTLDEENAEKARFGGVLLKDLQRADSAIVKQKTKAAELSGDLAAAMDLFQKQGGRKDALKDVSSMLRMEPSDFADYWRAFIGYGIALGLFGEDGQPAQLDMLEQNQEQERNAASIDAATVAAAKAAPAKPKMAPEPVH